ncbi:MAG: diaminopimelate decarboxylase [Methanomicrobiales archaeon]
MKFPPHLSIEGGSLQIGGHDCPALAAEFGTPLYVTDEQRIRANARRLWKALTAHYPDVRMLFAAKANGNLAIFRILADEGLGADVFSAGELRLARQAGMAADTLLFNGNSKSAADLQLAVDEGVRISVDSLDELRLLDGVAAEAGKIAEIAFRVNPALEVPTHPKIATGLRSSKFGIPADEILDAYREALALPHIGVRGIHCHIGSQILEVEPFARAAAVMVDLAREVTELGADLSFIDIGGGLGIPYRRDETAEPRFEEYADTVMPVFIDGIREAGISPALWVEPGRSLVGDSSLLLTRANSTKHAHRNFCNVDAGFNLLARPVMYDAYHEVVAAGKAEEPATETWTIAGPICESGDLLAEDRMLPPLAAGDLIAVLDVGAYGFAMSSQYNSRPRCAEVLVNGGKKSLIRRAEDMDDLTAAMLRPPWQ